MSLTASDGANAQQEPLSESTRRLVEWIAGGLLVLGGLLTATIGVAVYGGADRAWITTLVEEGRLQSTDLTNAELIDVTYGLAWWTGIGLMVTGLLVAIAGIVFLAYRRRTRARETELQHTAPDTTTNAIVGGFVTVLTSFVPFSPILGGLVSGYLQGTDRTDGVRVGAYAGLVLTAPVAVLFLFVIGGFTVVATELSIGAPSLFGVVGLFAGLLVTVTYLVGLSALGGYLGAALGERGGDATA